MCSLEGKDSNSEFKYDSYQTDLKGYKHLTLQSLEDLGNHKNANITPIFNKGKKRGCKEL